MENSRVHMGIISVPNRIDFKRNQINDLEYQSYIDELENLATKTAFSLREFDVSIDKLNGMEKTRENSSNDSSLHHTENGNNNNHEKNEN